MADFFHMGGYAFYVWTSYLLGAGALLLNLWWAHRSLVRARAAAKRRIGAKEGS